MNVAAHDGVVAALLVQPRMICGFANLHVVEEHKIGVGTGGAADVDAVDVVALGAFKPQAAGIDGVATAGALRRAAESKVRAVDARRTLDHRDLPGIVGEDDRITRGTGVVEGLLVAGGNRLRIRTTPEAHGLTGGGATGRFLWSFPGSRERARIRVRA